MNKRFRAIISELTSMGFEDDANILKNRSHIKNLEDVVREIATFKFHDYYGGSNGISDDVYGGIQWGGFIFGISENEMREMVNREFDNIREEYKKTRKEPHYSNEAGIEDSSTQPWTGR